MKKNYNKYLFCFFALSCIPLFGMEEEQEDQPDPSITQDQENYNNVLYYFSALSPTPLSGDECYLLWLKKLAQKAQSVEKIGSVNATTKIEPAALALLLDHPEAKNVSPLIAKQVYDAEIDRMFIQMLLGTTKPPIRLQCHPLPPSLKYHAEKKKVIIKCPSPDCPRIVSCPCAVASEIHLCGEKVSPSVYHSLSWIKKQSEHFGTSIPLSVLITNKGNILSSHSNNTVYGWDIGEKAEEDKETVGKDLSLKEVLMLKHMQRTRNPLNGTEALLKKLKDAAKQ